MMNGIAEVMRTESEIEDCVRSLDSPGKFGMFTMNLISIKDRIRWYRDVFFNGYRIVLVIHTGYISSEFSLEWS